MFFPPMCGVVTARFPVLEWNKAYSPPHACSAVALSVGLPNPAVALHLMGCLIIVTKSQFLPIACSGCLPEAMPSSPSPVRGFARRAWRQARGIVRRKRKGYASSSPRRMLGRLERAPCVRSTKGPEKNHDDLQLLAYVEQSCGVAHGVAARPLMSSKRVALTQASHAIFAHSQAPPDRNWHPNTRSSRPT